MFVHVANLYALRHLINGWKQVALTCTWYLAVGENVARGALLGALLGAQHGLQAFPVWTSGLKNKEPIMREIEQLVTLSKPTAIA